MRRIRILVTFLLALWCLSISAPLAAHAGIATVITAELTDLVDQLPGQDLWQVDYSLEADFQYAWSHGLTIWSPLATRLVFNGQGFLPGCGWDFNFLTSDPALLADTGLDHLSLSDPSCTTTPSRELIKLRFVWTGAGSVPSEIHRFQIYDDSFQTVESGTIQVPEPGTGAAQLAALAILALLWGARRGSRTSGAALALCAAMAGLAEAAPAKAEPVQGVVVHSYSVGSYEIDLQPVEFVRQSVKWFEYAFDVTVRNTGAAAGPVTLHVAAPRNSNGTGATLDIPAMAMGEEVELAARLELMIYRTAEFDTETLTFYFPLEPTLGPTLPESDLAIATLDEFIAVVADPNRSDPNWRRDLPAPPTLTFTPERTYYWSLVTNQGSMKFVLLDDVAPEHVSSIIYLSRVGFYDNLIFHRVITDFMAQGGGVHRVLGSQTPNYMMFGEYDPTVLHDAVGTLSTANAGEGTDSSGFFVTFGATAWLDGIHTISGRLVEGADTLTAISLLATPGGTPTSDIDILSSSIIVE